ncbi:hypothetical protein [Tomitella gaofuii]|uniref:hypothetical protein n=1 Tax=Tomitella gaofuii TaxID=2760083 RepID=UPI001F395022|nr:hypothetical protein [Tomitella gaofuii]
MIHGGGPCGLVESVVHRVDRDRGRVGVGVGQHGHNRHRQRVVVLGGPVHRHALRGAVRQHRRRGGRRDGEVRAQPYELRKLVVRAAAQPLGEPDTTAVRLVVDVGVCCTFRGHRDSG